MARRGRKQAPGLRYHKPTGQWYRRIAGRMTYFGADESQAYRRWHSFEAEKLKASILAEVKNDHAKIERPISQLTPDQNRQLSEAVDMAEYETLRRKLLSSDGPLPDDPTCQQVVDVYLAYCKAETSATHLIDARGRLKTWIAYVKGDTPITALTRDHFTRYRSMLNVRVKSGKLAQSSVNKMFTLVKGAFRTASREKGLTTPHLAAFLPILRSKKTEQTDVPILTPEDVATMLSEFSLMWQTITLLSLNCALSNTDIAFLEWNEILADESYLNLTRSKQKGIRRTPMWSRSIEKLAEWRKERKSKRLVFPNKNGVPFIAITSKSKNDNLSRAFSKRMRALDSDHTFGVFRKSAATIAKRATDADGVKMLLGDASEAIWKKHYVMTYPENVADGVHAIEDYYFGVTG